MKKLHVVTSDVTFDVEVPAELAVRRMFELTAETGGKVFLAC